MDAFEQIVAMYLEEEGYWVRKSVKVAITAADKRRIGLHSMPTPEIDLVAYNAKSDRLILIESKSFLDSFGVRYLSLVGKRSDAKRYRLLTDSNFQKIVSMRLLESFIRMGLIREKTKVVYGLACGKFHSKDEALVKKYCDEKGWLLITPKQIKDKVRSLSEKSWENNIVTITAKLILRA